MITRSEYQELEDLLDREQSPVHIYGEPGYGKSEILESLHNSEEESILLNIRNHDTKKDIIENLISYFEENSTKTSELFSLKDKISGINIAGIGGVGVQDGREKRPIDILKEAYENSKVRNSTIIIDDIHNLNTDPNIIRDIVEELSEACSASKIVSSGTMEIFGIENIELEGFSEEECKQLLESRNKTVDDETFEKIFNLLEGHPYFFDLYSKIEDEDLPNKEVRKFILDSYLSSLDQNEENLLKKSSILLELDSHICSDVLEKEETEISIILRNLENKGALREVSKNSEKTTVYELHNLFQTYLQERIKEKEKEKMHRRAFKYYADKLRRSDLRNFGSGFAHANLSKYHLEKIIEDKSVEKIISEFDNLNLEQPARFYFVYEYLKFFLTSDSEYRKIFLEELRDYHEWVREEIDEENEKLIVDLFLSFGESILKMSIEETSREGYKDLEDHYQNIKTGKFQDISLEDSSIEIENINAPSSLMLKLVKGFCLLILIKEADGYDSSEYKSELWSILEESGIQTSICIELNQRFKLLKSHLKDKLDFEEYIEDKMENVADKASKEERPKRRMFVFEDALIEIKENSGEMISNGDFLDEFDIDTEEFIIGLENWGYLLENADNPIFALIWHKFWKQLFEDRENFSKERVEYFDKKIEKMEELREDYEKKNDTHFKLDKIDDI